MARHDAALCMAKCGTDMFKLSLTCIASQLRDRFGKPEHGPRISGMTVRQHPAVGVEWFATAGLANAAG